MQEEGWLRPFLRAVVAVAVFLPAFILAITVDKAAELAAWGNMILVSLIPALYGSMSLFFLVDWVNTKIGLLKMNTCDSNKSASSASLQRRDTYGSSRSSPNGLR